MVGGASAHGSPGVLLAPRGHLREPRIWVGAVHIGHGRSGHLGTHLVTCVCVWGGEGEGPRMTSGVDTCTYTVHVYMYTYMYMHIYSRYGT